MRGWVEETFCPILSCGVVNGRRIRLVLTTAGCVGIYRHYRERRPLHNHRHTRENGYPGVGGQLK